MGTTMKIDFVSDVSCPWCIIGLNALEQAIERLGDDVDVALHFQPFELNPQMPADGQELYEHMQQKYGSTKEQSDAAREMIRARGEELGFTFRMDRLQRIYNTFDTHRLLHWAALEGRQAELKRALFSAYFTDGENPGDREVLLRAAAHVGLDTAAAAAVLDSDRYAGDVRAQQAYYHQHGIHAVPAVVINDRHLIQGGQPVEVFEQALREIAAEAAGDDPAQP
ncbi:MAG: DsbA family oxidoreductase [Gammaproteobacteria bacterium]